MTQFISHLFFFFLERQKKFWPHPAAHGISVSPARDWIHTHYIRRWSLNHWGTRKVPIPYLFHEVLLYVDYRKEVLPGKWIWVNYRSSQSNFPPKISSIYKASILLVNRRRQWQSYLQSRNRHTDVEDKCMATKGVKKMGRKGNWEWHIYTINPIHKTDN